MTVKSDQSNRNRISLLLKFSITCALLFWVIRLVDSQQLLLILQNTNMSYVLYALASHVIAFLLLSIRWWYLLHLKYPACKYSDTAGSYYLGLFFNNFLPTGIGGDVIRVIRLKKMGLKLDDLLTSTVMDRVVGLTSIVLMGLTALIFFKKIDIDLNTRILLFCFALCIPAGIVAFRSNRLWNLFIGFFRAGKTHKIFRFLYSILTAFGDYRKYNQQMLAALLLSFVAQCFIIFSYLFIGKALSLQLPTPLYFTIVPIVFMATSLPISIGGLGMRESVLISLLTIFAIDTQLAIALSLIYFSMLVVITLPAAMIIIRRVQTQQQTI